MSAVVTTEPWSSYTKETRKNIALNFRICIFIFSSLLGWIPLMCTMSWKKPFLIIFHYMLRDFINWILKRLFNVLKLCLTASIQPKQLNPYTCLALITIAVLSTIKQKFLIRLDWWWYKLTEHELLNPAIEWKKVCLHIVCWLLICSLFS